MLEFFLLFLPSFSKQTTHNTLFLFLIPYSLFLLRQRQIQLVSRDSLIDIQHIISDRFEVTTSHSTPFPTS